jgi:hypothetical protein
MWKEYNLGTGEYAFLTIQFLYIFKNESLKRKSRTVSLILSEVM